MTGLGVFSDPRSVAVVGASGDPAKWGHWLAKGALAGSARRTVHLVNRNGAEVLGATVAPSLGALPEVPELVVLAVPAAGVADVVDEALELGVRGFLGITAGVPDEAALAARIRAAGGRLLGPNCLGIFDADTDLRLAWGRFQVGSLGIVSQSGQLGLEIAGLAGSSGLGVSRFVSVGNQVDVTAVDVLAELGDHHLTKVVGLYLESFTHTDALLATIAALREAGKPTVLLTAGESVAAREAASTHTGALTSALDVVDAACRRAGAVRVRTPAELVDLADLLAVTRFPVGRRVGIVADSGGQGVIAADLAAHHGLVVPVVSGRVTDRLPAQAGARNPIDLAGAGEQDLTNYARVVEALADSGEVDSVLLSGYFGSYGNDTPSLHLAELAIAARLEGIARNAGLPVVVHSMAADSATVCALRSGGVPVHRTVERALAALGSAARLGPGQVPPVVERPDVVPEFRPGYLGARELVESVGVAFPDAVAITSEDDLETATAKLRPPYALKADWLAHKTEHAAVVLDLPDDAAVRAAYADLVDRVGPGVVVLEEMDTRRDVVELLVAVRRDPAFGPVVAVGAGGVRAELYRDTAVDLAPVDAAQAERLVRRLRSAPELDGWRGRPGVDVAALVRVVVAVSTLLEHRADLTEVELNPVRVGADGVLAVDALVVR
jgi:acyl-CoA synthetase (NDP forming)